MERKSPRERLTLFTADVQNRRAAFAQDVRKGLTSTPKHLSCCYFYDQDGSALFEAICHLPEYYLTRAEREILAAHNDELAGSFPNSTVLVEFGSGSASKTRLIIEGFLRNQNRLRYVPIDICRTVLEESSLELLRDYLNLEVVAVAAEYREGLEYVRNEAGGSKLLLWLGSNVGNFHRAEAGEFLRNVRVAMTLADRMLVGIDLRKDRAILEPAYDDSQGMTAEFNRNLLVRINRELSGHFDLETFSHRAVYNERIGRIEMYLVSTCPQRVHIEDLHLEVQFTAGEAIHTENSYKYSLAEIDALAAAAGFQIERQWFDAEGRFSVNVLAPKPHA